MPAQHSLHVALTKRLVRPVGEQVASGRYPTASVVVRAALAMKIASDEAEAPRQPFPRQPLPEPGADA